MAIVTKHDFYREKISGTPYVLCKESAAEFLDLSNGNFGTSICYYENDEGVEYFEDMGMKCTTVNQTINDLLADEKCDEQILLESLSNYYFEHKESFSGLVILPTNIIRFEKLKQWAIEYYND